MEVDFYLPWSNLIGLLLHVQTHAAVTEDSHKDRQAGPAKGLSGHVVVNQSNCPLLINTQSLAPLPDYVRVENCSDGDWGA